MAFRNMYVFNDLTRECLALTVGISLSGAWAKLEAWRRGFDETHPYPSLGFMTPAKIASSARVDLADEVQTL